jgi:hypothetical protein
MSDVRNNTAQNRFERGEEMQSAAGVPGIEEDRSAAVDQRRERTGLRLVGDRGHHQHDEIGPIEGLGKIGGHQGDRNEPFVNAARLDAALPAQLIEALGIARMEPHGEAATAEVGRRRAAAVSGAHPRASRQQLSCGPLPRCRMTTRPRLQSPCFSTRESSPHRC